MTIKYGLQVWDTQAFPLVKLSSSPNEYFDIPKLNAQRTSLMQQHAAPSQNILKFAESLRQQSETLSSEYPWITKYLQDLSTQFQQQSKVVLTINIPKNPARFTILAYIVSLAASQHRMVTYNAAGDFYILPLPTMLENSRFIDLYKNNIQAVPCTYVYPFMKIYRNALIAERVVKPKDLIDWDQYNAKSNFNCEFEARDMVQQRMIANFLERDIAFVFQEQTRYFMIPIKKLEDTSFFLEFSLSTAIEQQGIGRIMVDPYITAVFQKKHPELDSLIINVNERFHQIFNEKIDPLSISALWSVFDLKNNSNSTYFMNYISEYNMWSELFEQIDQLIEYSSTVILDINSIEDFSNSFKCVLATGAKFKDIVGFKESHMVNVCYLIYAKIFNEDMLRELSREVINLYLYSEHKEDMNNLIDYIQNYELAT